MIDLKAAKAKRPIRFLIAGGANTAFGLAIYPALLWSVPWLEQHYMVALLIAQAVSLCFAFTTYKLGVFRTRGNLLREFATFCSFYLANYAANWVALPLLVEVAHVPPIIAQVGFTVVLVLGSYFWHSRVTFRASRCSAPLPEREGLGVGPRVRAPEDSRSAR